MVWTSNNPVGITNPTYNKVQQVKVIKRTLRCLKLHIKETSIKMLDMQGPNPVLAPPLI